MKPEIRILADAEALAREAAQLVVAAAERAMGARGAFFLVLSGGATPQGLYGLLAKEPFRSRVYWGRTEVFFGDERCVPLGDPASNYRLARTELLSRVSLRPEAVHRIPGELGPDRAADLYEEEIRRAGAGGKPRFDLVLLGLGTDGHTASLFPGDRALLERRRLAVPATAPAPPRERVTLTLPVLNAAREVLFLVEGEKKAEALAAVLGAEMGSSPAAFPAARVHPSGGRLRWLVDRWAARLLPEETG